MRDVEAALPTAPEPPEIVGSPSPALRIGQVLAGRHDIVQHLGTGGMGAVYRAHDRVLGEDVALKVLRPELSSDPRALERFRQEVRTARRVHHPNVVRVFDVAEADGQTFLTMELLDGGTLRDRAAGDRASIGERLRWLGEIARGVAAVHALGILHRDLKPENVLFRGGDTAVVSDFGLAMPADATTTSLAGTPVYMSPEQLRGEPLDAKSDVFALGILGQELLTGRRPFGEGPAPLVTSAILRDPPLAPEIDGVEPEQARALAALLGRALAKDPSARPSAGAFAAELAALMDRSSNTAVRAGVKRTSSAAPRDFEQAVEPARTPAPKGGREPASPRLSPWLAGLLALGALAGALAWPRGDPARPPQGGVATGTAEPALLSPALGAGVVLLHVAPTETPAGDPQLEAAGAAVNDAARRALATVRGARVVPEASGAHALVTSVRRVDGRLRFTGQSRAPSGEAEPAFTVDAADTSSLLDAVRDRVSEEGRLRVAAATRARRVATCAGPTQEALATYERLVGPAARSEHVTAGMPLLDAVLAADPRCGHAHVERAQLLALRGAAGRALEDLDAAEAELREALVLDARDVEALVSRCRLRVFRPSLMTAIDDAAIDGAERACVEARQADPGSARVRRYLASLLDRTCRDEEAMASLEEAAALERAVAGDALAHLVELALQNGRIGVAERRSLELLAVQEEEERLGPAAWSRRAGLDPPAHAHFARAEVLLRLGNDAEAAAMLRRELARSGTGSVDVLTELASLRALTRLGPRAGQPPTRDEADRLRVLESEIESVAARDPSVAVAVAGALVWKDTEAAIRWLDRAGAPDDCSGAVRRAMIYKAGERVEEARRALRACAPATKWESRCLEWARRRVGP